MGLLPCMWTDLRTSLSPDVVCTDASEEGGGACVSTGLTPKGVHQLKRFDEDPSVNTSDLLIVSDFDGMGGLLMAVELLGVVPCGIVVIESRKTARAIVKARWPTAVCYSDIKEISEATIQEWVIWYPMAKRVLHGSGFPCQDLSGLNANRKGPTGARSSLISCSLDISRWLRGVTNWRVADIFENVASMSLEHSSFLSDRIGVRPVYLEAGELSRCRRPRLYWLRGMAVAPGTDIEITSRQVRGGDEIKVLQCRVPDVNRFLSSGFRSADPSIDTLPGWAPTFYTFTQPIPRRTPPLHPAGVHSASPQALARWEHDAYRVQPYQYETKNLVCSDHQGPRRLLAFEQARLLGFPAHHLDPVKKKFVPSGGAVRTTLEDEMGQFCGNSFAVVAVARLIAGFVGGAESIPENGRCSLSGIWREWEVLDLKALERAREESAGWSRRFGGTPSSSSTVRTEPTHDREQRLTNEQALVGHYTRLADHRGSDIRLDVGVPYRREAWPRMEISSEQWKWRVFLSYRWHHQDHINVLEVAAAFDALRSMVKKASSHSCRRLFLLDSQVAIGVLTKGRSSSRRLNFILSRFAAVSVAANVFPVFGWVSSAKNPADGPSRWPAQRLSAAPKLQRRVIKHLLKR